MVITNTSAEPPNNCKQGVKKYEAQDNNGHHADLYCMPNGQMFKRLYSTHSSHDNQHKMSFRNKCEAKKKGLRHRNAKQTTKNPENQVNVTVHQICNLTQQTIHRQVNQTALPTTFQTWVFVFLMEIAGMSNRLKNTFFLNE